jgi:small subunit ribosomal protein S1
VEAPITNIANFGAFVDLGEGVEGMIHVGDITRERRIEHPKDVLKAGQIVKAQVLEFDKDRRRIRLGMKQLEPTSVDIWVSEHQIGDTVTGRVTDVKPDRAKVELGDGVYGVCKLSAGEGEQEAKGGAANRADISQLGAMLAARWKSGPDIEAEQKVIRAGQIRQFRLASVDPQSKRIELEMAG